MAIFSCKLDERLNLHFELSGDPHRHGCGTYRRLHLIFACFVDGLAVSRHKQTKKDKGNK